MAKDTGSILLPIIRSTHSLNSKEKSKGLALQSELIDNELSFKIL
jgi:hypothetical protein